MPVEINSLGYLNEPVVSVKICSPGTSICKIVGRILLDTGSSGLRIFASQIKDISLNQVLTSSGQEVAKCTNYADGTAQWGPIKSAKLVLGGETIENVNIQIIDAAYSSVPNSCVGVENDPIAAGYNGILGVGIRDYDCGAGCSTNANSNLYFSCGPTKCTSSAISLSGQVRNPIAVMNSNSNSEGINDSNGSALMLPSVPITGAFSASGYLIFGIGTRKNNSPVSDTKFFTTDDKGFMKTNYLGKTIPSFIDSGSNGLFFPATTQNQTCSGWFCPQTPIKLSAINYPNSGSGFFSSVSFDIINSQQVFISHNHVYASLGAELSTHFDWGLPFFLGKTVYTGIIGKTMVWSVDGNSYTGPYYAY